MYGNACFNIAHFDNTIFYDQVLDSVRMKILIEIAPPIY